MKVRTKALPFEQGVYKCYIGVGEPKILSPILKVEYHKDSLGLLNPSNGYQRPPSPSRLSDIADFRKKMPLELFPTAIFLSSRQKMEFDEMTGELVLDTNEPVYIIDGNHRFEGTKRAMELGKKFTDEDKMVAELIGETPVPFVLVEGISKEKEMEMFVKINGTAKSVDTALCLQILSMENRGKALSSIESSLLPKAIIIQVANKLTSTSGSPWHMQIATLSGKYSEKSDKALKRGMVGKATSFVESMVCVYKYLETLRVFQNSGQTQDMQVTMLFNLVVDFWNAVKAVNPAIFGNPIEFAVQRSTGMYALHMLMPDILAELYELPGGKANWTLANMKSKLDAYGLLKDTDFWKNTSTASAVGVMVGSGSKAYRALYKMLVESNPARKAN